MTWAIAAISVVVVLLSSLYVIGLSNTGAVTEEQLSLRPGSHVRSADGLMLYAPEGLLTAPLGISVRSSQARLGQGLEALGETFHLSSQRLLDRHYDPPIVIALPVPRAAASYAVAVSSALSLTWELFYGHYDETLERYLIQLPTLSPRAVQLTLVKSDGQMFRRAPEDRFGIICESAFPYCQDALREELIHWYEQIWQDMHDQAGLLPPLLERWTPYTFERSSIQQAGEPVYLVRVFSACDSGRGESGSSSYLPSFHLLTLCVPQGVLTDAVKRHARHEYLHAVQEAYPALRCSGWQAGLCQASLNLWLLEGTAVAAERSSAQAMTRSTYQANTVPQTGRTPFRLEQSPYNQALQQGYQYQMQDFWVYLGRRFDLGLDYFATLFAAGATPQAVDSSLRQLTGQSLSEIYWGFVKHQAYEKDLPDFFEGVPFAGQACTVNPAAVSLNQTVFHAASSERRFEGIRALQSGFSRLRFNPDETAYRGVVRLIAASEDVNYKFYQHAETDCVKQADNVPLEVTITDEPQVYYLLFSHTAIDKRVEPVTVTLSFERSP